MRTALVTLFAILTLVIPGALAEELTLWEVAASRQAKTVCSGVFISGRTTEDVLKNDVGVPDPATVNIDVDRAANKVTINLADGTAVTSIYREGCGCTNIYDTPESKVRAQPTSGIPLRETLSEAQPWPIGEGAPAEAIKFNKRKMKKALKYAFDEPEKDMIRGTRAVVVIHKGQIVAEQYADGYSKHQPLIIWSMGKSITSVLTGILVKQGKLDIMAPAPVPEWADENDPRHAITTDQLLRMSSGLKFEEVYTGALVDVVKMLYGKTDTASYAASQPLEAEVGNKYYYSSGTTNIISRILKNQIGDDATYFEFPYKELFHKIGMHNTIMEPDASGTYIGSSFTYATARDMARFGLFTMHNGEWNGEQILPEDWMEYARTPTTAPGDKEREYGAQFWLNYGSEDDPSKRRWPSLPHDTFGLSGFQGQSVAAIPSRDTVIVRLGLSSERKAWNQDKFMAMVLEALPE